MDCRCVKRNGGSAGIVEICKHIWQFHEAEIRNSGDLLYTWQYDMRWAAKSFDTTVFFNQNPAVIEDLGAYVHDGLRY